MHGIPNVEVARRKAKATEAKFENFQSNNRKSYLQKSMHSTTYANKNKYIPSPRRDERKSLKNQPMKEGKFRRCVEKWNPKHKFHS